MISRTAKSVFRAVLIAPLVACLVCAPASAEEAKPAAPAAKGAAPSATVPSAKAPGAPAGEPGATGASKATGSSAGDTDCERYVGALQGKGDRSLLDKPEGRALTLSANDLVMCRAVLTDSDAPCSQLKNAGGPNMACSETVDVFRDLKKHPDTHAFMFTEGRVQECHKVSWVDPKVCEDVRAALLANDATKCAPERRTMCRAYIELDPSLCQVPPEAEQQFRDAIKKGGKDVYEKQKDEPPLVERCKKEIESKKFLAQGLKALAESGPPRERALARAALGQKDACEEFVAPALEACRKAAPPTPGGQSGGDNPTPKPDGAPGDNPTPKPDAAPAEKPKA